MNAVFAIAAVVVKELLRRKDFYVLFIVTALLTVLMGSVNIFNDDRITRYLKEICLFLIWISMLVIAIATAARQLPSEKENRTIFPLLAKPVRRWEIVLGKFLGCWVACGFALVCFYLFFGVAVMAREHEWPLANYFQAAWLHWIMLGTALAMTILGSIVFTAVSSNTTITFAAIAGMLLLGRHLHKVALQLSEPSRTLLEILYFCMPHLEYFDARDLLIHNWQAIRWQVCAEATLYGCAYTAFFLLLACLAFRRKSLV
jgi:ABC-type transport system involved in multi-copper enzyme maturation permease subunit